MGTAEQQFQSKTRHTHAFPHAIARRFAEVCTHPKRPQKALKACKDATNTQQKNDPLCCVAYFARPAEAAPKNEKEAHADNISKRANQGRKGGRDEEERGSAVGR
eukprot:4006944-Pleurochrysis_carterae.AAC.1